MIIWTMDNGDAGMRAQTRGLAMRIAAAEKNVSVIKKTVAAGFFCRAAPMDENVAPPDMIIACGRAAVPAALAAKLRYNAFAIYLQRPPNPSKFDAVICGEHDNLSAPNVLSIVGAVGGVRADNLPPPDLSLPRPVTGVLVGGENRAYKLTPKVCKNLMDEIQAPQNGEAILLTTSRRTGKENMRAFADQLSDKNFLPPADGHNPYRDILSTADRLVVTADSVNMLSEACSLGKPVYIFPLPKKLFSRRTAKFENFHRRLVARGLAKMWDGKFSDWTPPLLDETTRAARFVLARWSRQKNAEVL